MPDVVGEELGVLLLLRAGRVHGQELDLAAAVGLREGEPQQLQPGQGQRGQHDIRTR